MRLFLARLILVAIGVAGCADRGSPGPAAGTWTLDAAPLASLIAQADRQGVSVTPEQRASLAVLTVMKFELMLLPDGSASLQASGVPETVRGTWSQDGERVTFRVPSGKSTTMTFVHKGDRLTHENSIAPFDLRRK